MSRSAAGMDQLLISSHVLKQCGYSLAHSKVGQGTQVIRKRPDQELVAEESIQAVRVGMPFRLRAPQGLRQEELVLIRQICVDTPL